MSLVKEPIAKVHLHAHVKRLTGKGERIVELATAKGEFRDAVAALNACTQLCELDAQLRMNPTRRGEATGAAVSPKTKGASTSASPEEQVDFDTAFSERRSTTLVPMLIS